MSFNYQENEEQIETNEKLIESYIKEEYGCLKEFGARLEILKTLAIHNEYSCDNEFHWQELLSIGEEIFEIAIER